MSTGSPESADTTADVERSQVDVDDKDICPCYANFRRVSSTPEEWILDLGMNPQPLIAVA
jgi:hypothetical protein